MRDGETRGRDDRELSESFLGPEEGSVARYKFAMDLAEDAVVDAVTEDGVYSGASPEAIRESFDDIDCIPDVGEGIADAVELTRDHVLSDAVRFHHPNYLAHLNGPPTTPALAADAMIAALNQNHASWDVGPSVDILEEAMIAELGDLFGYPESAAGVFTTGGTQANFVGIFLARGWYADEFLDTDVQAEGLPPEADEFRILRSEVGHPTTDEAAAKLGLGEEAVVAVPTDDRNRMDPDALEATVDRLESAGKRPIAVTATAGTTDFGSVDPLEEIAAVAADHDLWFHVDAAYGGALAVSDRHRGRLDGIERADSLAVDFHKFLFQPASCGAFLLRDESNYVYLGHEVAYLNPARDSVPHRTQKSFQWTRRADVLKPFVTFRTLGREGLAALVERVVDLTDAAADRIDDDPAFELVADPEISTVVFRYTPSTVPADASRTEWSNEVNDAIRDAALDDGRTLVARTQVDGETCLKFTLLNPTATVDDVDAVLDLLREFGERIERERTDGG
jgi:L-2,4-diaminobutyrate decarboxylase